MPPVKKQQRPRLDAIIRHIKAGSYDDDMSQLQGAIADRQRIRQEAVLGLVSEVFGEGFTVQQQNSAQERKNPFVERAAAERLPNEVLPGESPHVQSPTGDGLPDDEEDLGPDYESRSPIIGSIDDRPEG